MCDVATDVRSGPGGSACGQRVLYDEWRTPLSVYGPLADRYEFTVDAAAAEWNARHERFWSIEDSAFGRSWAGERVWCNPPYSDPGPWIRKAREADVAVFLLPLWGSRLWLARACELCHSMENIGRVPFEGRLGFGGVMPAWSCGVFVFVGVAAP